MYRKLENRISFVNNLSTVIRTIFTGSMTVLQNVASRAYPFLSFYAWNILAHTIAKEAERLLFAPWP